MTIRNRMEPSVTAVVVSWNVRDPLRECLSALRDEASGCLLEIFVVDNASPDGSAAMVAAEFPEARLIANSDNTGFAAACNQALRGARGQYFALVNPDARVAPGALGKLVRFLSGRPQAGAAGPCLLNPDGSLQPNGGPFPSLWGTFLRVVRVSAIARRWYDRRFRWGRGDFDRAARVQQLSGACLMLRRAALEGVGLLDEQFFLYFEEVDWLLRARQAGWEAWYVPSARVTHRWAASTSQTGARAVRLMAVSERRYWEKHGPRWAVPLARLLTRAELHYHLASHWLRDRQAGRKRGEGWGTEQ